MKKPVVASMLEEAGLVDSIGMEGGRPTLRLTPRGRGLSGSVGRPSLGRVLDWETLRRTARARRRRQDPEG